MACGQHLAGRFSLVTQHANHTTPLARVYASGNAHSSHIALLTARLALIESIASRASSPAASTGSIPQLRMPPCRKALRLEHPPAQRHGSTAHPPGLARLQAFRTHPWLGSCRKRRAHFPVCRSDTFADGMTRTCSSRPPSAYAEVEMRKESALLANPSVETKPAAGLGETLETLSEPLLNGARIR